MQTLRAASWLGTLALAAALGGSACRSPKASLASVTFGAAILASRTTMDKVGTFDEPILAGPNGLVSLRIDPPSQAECMPELDKDRLHATANGTPMKTEAAGGAHVEHPMGPSHFPTKQTVCDPIRFTIPREAIKPGDGGVVAFEIADGDTTLRLAWAHPFDHRTVQLVDHPPSLAFGEHVALQWTPDDDDLTPQEHVEACLKPAPSDRCPRSLNGSQCIAARLQGKKLEFDVPAGWSCVTTGGLAATGIHPAAHVVACDPRLKRCRADLVPAVQAHDVQIAR